MQILGFDDAFMLLIGNEGGYSNNPDDPGGETMWGITKRVAVEEGYLGDMKLLPLATAKSIAKRRYWDVVHGDSLDPEIAFQLLDFVYNGGPAAKAAQKAAGVTVDGIIGPKTIAALKAKDRRAVIMVLNAERLDYMASLKILPKFGPGWMHRIANDLREGAD